MDNFAVRVFETDLTLNICQFLCTKFLMMNVENFHLKKIANEGGSKP